jgi:hypothetical protein
MHIALVLSEIHVFVCGGNRNIRSLSSPEFRECRRKTIKNSEIESPCGICAGIDWRDPPTEVAESEKIDRLELLGSVRVDNKWVDIHEFMSASSLVTCIWSKLSLRFINGSQII